MSVRNTSAPAKLEEPNNVIVTHLSTSVATARTTFDKGDK